MEIFVLRAKWEEHYDCPDNGDTKICDTYEDIKFSDCRSYLQSIADDLNSGFKGTYWSEKRSKAVSYTHLTLPTIYSV